MRSRFLAAVVAGTVVAALVIPLFASARHLDVRDPNDTRGLLDVRRVRVIGEERPRFTVLTFRRWTTADIYDRGFVLVYLDTFGNERFDYYALLRSVGGAMQGTLFRDRSRKRDLRVATLNIFRMSKDGVSVRIPLRSMRFGTTRLHYVWSVQTLMSNGRCRRVCFDRAPDSGGILEPRQTVTATVP